MCGIQRCLLGWSFPRRSMRRHQAHRKALLGQMKNFKYLMQSLVQQVHPVWAVGGSRQWAGQKA